MHVDRLMWILCRKSRSWFMWLRTNTYVGVASLLSVCLQGTITV